MKKTRIVLVAAAAVTSSLTLHASAAINIVQQAAAAPTYGTTLNFDEAGTPTGLLPNDTWLSSHGLTITDGVNPNALVVDDVTDSLPWVGTGNVAVGTWGLTLDFNQEVSSLSFQAWDPSGPPAPFGGGMYVVILDDNDSVIAGNGFNPAWGGIGNTWYNLTTSGGDTFHRVVIYNGGFDPTSFVDNVSWTTVPAPGALALLGLAGLVRSRRRR